jgi:hypothetical protein
MNAPTATVNIIFCGVPVSSYITLQMTIMFTHARYFLLETPWRIIIPNPNVNSHSCEPFILCISQA